MENSPSPDELLYGTKFKLHKPEDRSSSMARFFGPPERHLKQQTRFQAGAPDSLDQSTIICSPVIGKATSQPLESHDLPQNIRRLIAEYEQIKGKGVPLPFVTKYRHEDLYMSKRGQPCQWAYIKTGNPVVAEQVFWQRHKYFIVVRGGGLSEPAIINTRPHSGAPPNCRFYYVWKGLEGDENEPSILRIFGSGTIDDTLKRLRQRNSASRNHPSEARGTKTVLGKRSDRSDSEPRQRDGDDESSREQMQPHGCGAGGPAAVGTSGQGDDRETFLSPSAAFPSLQTESRVADVPLDGHRSCERPSPDSEPPTTPTYPTSATSLASEMAGRTIFIFKKDGGSQPRIRPFSKCDIVELLFMHARLGGLSLSKAPILSVQIHGSKEKLEVGYNDEQDFYQVIHAIKSDACWARSDTTECKIDVRAVELRGS